jgi:uncharacterized protein YbjT (DUF2867 family)
MKILIFGATGMVGQGVLLACLRAPDVERVTVVGRSATGGIDPKLEEIVHPDFLDFSAIRDRLRGPDACFDACFFCLGVSSTGMKEADYERVTYGFTLAAAETLAAVKTAQSGQPGRPGMTFIYVSGAGTDSSEKGRVMWARVKGRTENALLRLPLDAYMFRPGAIEPMDGIRSKTTAYRVGYVLMRPLMPLLRRMMPNQIVPTRDMGQAMLNVARHGYGKRILDPRDIRAAAEQ